MTYANFSQTILDVLECREVCEPHAVAFRGLRPDGAPCVVTYSELARRVRAIAAVLREQLDPGDRALLLFEPGIDYIQTLLGCLMAGVISVPAYPPDLTRRAQAVKRLWSLTRDSRPKVALCSSLTAQLLAALGSEETAGLRWVPTDKVPECLGFERDRSHVARPSDIAVLQYTSGSTGDPKGVVLTHACLSNNCALIQRRMQLSRDTHSVSWLPPYHDMGLIGMILTPLFIGCEATVMSPLDFIRRPASWLEAISTYKGTASAAPNFAYELCTRKVDDSVIDSLDLSSWVMAAVAGEPIRAGTLERFARRFERAKFSSKAFLPCYGLAECTLYAVGRDLGTGYITATIDRARYADGEIVLVPEDSPNAMSVVGCGRVDRDDVDVAIHDSNGSLRDGDLQLGEIWVRSASVARGYWDKPAASAAVFHASKGAPGTWFATGDAGFVYDGELYVSGRLKETIVSHGRKYYPNDLEQNAEISHPAIRKGAVVAFAISNEESEAAGIAAEVLQAEALEAAQLDEIAKCIREAVAVATEVSLAAVHLLPPGSIPKTSSGKLQRLGTRSALETGELVPIRSWRNQRASWNTAAQASV